MKKVVNINLGGKAFTIDEDAYDALSRYLKQLERHFASSHGSDDIVYDIELRISELFEEDARYGDIITIKKVDKVISTMGRPEDFEGEDTIEAKDSRDYTRGPKIKTGKRLFRDPDNKVFAGICSGLAQYFGINDPLVIRILFVVFFFVGGFTLIAYPIMWIVVPKAKSSSDFLAMRGEEINIDNIAKTVEQGIQDIKEKIEDISKGFKSVL